MLNGGLLVFIAFLLMIAGALYIRLRWRRAPQAYRAMIALALGYFIAGAVAGAWVVHRAAPRPVEVVSASPGEPMAAPVSGLAGAYLPNGYSGKVVRVTDGDTIDVALDPSGAVQSVRLAGIDAPESE
jgi:hypothetical protein